jgi:hypothetical protein
VNVPSVMPCVRDSADSSVTGPLISRQRALRSDAEGARALGHHRTRPGRGARHGSRTRRVVGSLGTHRRGNEQDDGHQGRHCQALHLHLLIWTEPITRAWRPRRDLPISVPACSLRPRLSRLASPFDGLGPSARTVALGAARAFASAQRGKREGAVIRPMASRNWSADADGSMASRSSTIPSTITRPPMFRPCSSMR